MNKSIEKELPSERIQKEYEANPSKILTKIRKENIIKKSNLPLILKNDNIDKLINLNNKLISSQKDNCLNSNFEDSETKLNKNIIDNKSYKKNYDEFIEVSNNNKKINNNNYNPNNNKNNNMKKVQQNKDKNIVENMPIKIYYINNIINKNYFFSFK